MTAFGGEVSAHEGERAERADRDAPRDYYEILGVRRDATAEDIRRAYRRLARLYHPDLNPGDTEAEERFKQINDAYDTLSDPGRRAEYDRTHIPARDLLAAVETILARYVVFSSPAQRTALVLWIAHAHSLDAFDVTPYLNVRSAEKRCGKTRLLELLAELTPRAWHAIQPSEAVLYRKIARDTPTLLLDEVDAIFTGPPSDRTEGLRALLNAGYRRGWTVDRCVGRGMKLAAFPVFCCKALAGIGTLPDTLADRSIPVALLRRKKSEPVVKFKLRDFQPEAAPLRTALATWADSAVKRLREARPEMPNGLGDRAEEVWEPLVAIADEAGGQWAARARAAAVELSGGEPDTESTGIVLLKAIFEVFETRATTRILTIDLLVDLIERETEPYGGWWGKDVQQALKDGEAARGPAAKLAKLLKPFGVIPKSIRTPEGGKGKGYERADFVDAWERYLIVRAPEKRDNGTTHGAEGVEVPRPSPTDNKDGTPQNVAAQGLSRRPDFKSSNDADDGLDSEPCASCGAPGGAGWSSTGETWCAPCWRTRVALNPAPTASEPPNIPIDGEADDGERDELDDREDPAAEVPSGDGHTQLSPFGPAPPSTPCRCCGASNWHLAGSGWTCSTCHPTPTNGRAPGEDA